MGESRYARNEKIRLPIFSSLFSDIASPAMGDATRFARTSDPAKGARRATPGSINDKFNREIL